MHLCYKWMAHVTQLSLRGLTTVVFGSDSMQLVLKPLGESLGRLILLIWIGYMMMVWDYNSGRISDDRTGKTTSLMQPMRGMD